MEYLNREQIPKYLIEYSTPSEKPAYIETFSGYCDVD